MLMAHHYIKISPKLDIYMQVHPFSYYKNMIIKNNLHFIKLNHVYFELLYWLKNKHTKMEASEMLRVHDETLNLDVENIIKNIEKTSIILGVSNVLHVYDLKLGNKTFRDLDYQNAEVIKDTVPPNYVPHSALIWKYFCLTNELSEFFKEIKDYSIVVVGMDHLKELNSIFPNMKHYALTFESCTVENREKHLYELYNLINDGKKNIVLFQAGEPYSTWLIYKLSFELKIKNCSLIDMGRALDYFCPNRKMIESDKKKSEGLLHDFSNQRWMNLKLK